MTRFLFGVSAAAAAFLIIGLASGLSFHGDEWAYIVDRRLTLQSMIQPHNEHLAFLHVLIYRGLVEAFGTGSYLPFLSALMLVHVTTAAGVLALLSRHVSLPAALACAVLVLFLGTGFDNLVWGFQIGFAGAVALGIWAMVAAHRPPASAALLTAALWTSGSALFFIAPVAVLIVSRRWLALPLGTYAAWILVIGRESVPVPDPGSYIAYAATGVGSAVGGIAGFGVVAGWVITLGLLVMLSRSGRPSAVVVAGILGLVSEFAILAFGRAQFGPQQAEAPRYIYAAAPFVLIALTGINGIRREVWAGAFAVAWVLNISALPRGVALYHSFLNYDRSISLEQRLEPFRP